MAMRLAARAALKSPSQLRGLLFSSVSSTMPFTPSPAGEVTSKREMADPNTNLFVSGLNKRTTTDGLREFAAKFGNVVSAKVVTDRGTGYSKGFGFVNYASLEDAAEGIKGMDAQFLDGWVIFAEYAKPKPELPQNPMRPYVPRNY